MDGETAGPTHRDKTAMNGARSLVRVWNDLKQCLGHRGLTRKDDEERAEIMKAIKAVRAYKYKVFHPCHKVRDKDGTPDHSRFVPPTHRDKTAMNGARSLVRVWNDLKQCLGHPPVGGRRGWGIGGVDDVSGHGLLLFERGNRDQGTGIREDCKDYKRL